MATVRDADQIIVLHEGRIVERVTHAGLFRLVVLRIIMEDSLSTEEMLLRVFWMVDEKVAQGKQCPDAQLYPSTMVTLGLLFARKGGKYRPCDRWRGANLGDRFPKLPEPSRLHRLFPDYSHLTDRCLQEPSFFPVIDTFGLELMHPRREGRSFQP
jgi:hypothetical protein